MSDKPDEFLFEYIYEPSPEAEERFSQAMDLILALLLEDYEQEQREKSESERKP